MSTRATLAGLCAAVTWCCVASCSAEVGTPIPDRDGTLAGNPPPSATSSPDSGASPPSPAPASDGGGATTDGWTDAGAWPVTPEAASPVAQDSGSGSLVDTGAPSPGTGSLGSCGNPACASDGNECGCQATDSTGNVVQMGCQAGGECICVVDQQTSGQPFDENGACSAQTSMASLFITSCPCQ